MTKLSDSPTAGYEDNDPIAETSKKSKLFRFASKAPIFMGTMCNLVLLILFNYGGLTIDHKVMAYTVMGCAGFFTAVLFILAAIKPYIYRQSAQ